MTKSPKWNISLCKENLNDVLYAIAPSGQKGKKIQCNLSAEEVKSLCFQYNSKMHNAFSSITAVIALEVLKAT